MTKKALFRIGDLARESGVKVVTIRYYEQIGLIRRLLARAGTTARTGSPLASGSNSFGAVEISDSR